MWNEIINRLNELGYTQAEIASSAGVTQGYISKISSGACQVDPRFDVAMSIFNLLPEDEKSEWLNSIQFEKAS